VLNKTLTLGSLFDGSGGFPLGGLHCGIEPLWASEVEPFPIRVTTKRLPQMKHLGDINKLNGATVPPVDIITGAGFGCPDLNAVRIYPLPANAPGFTVSGRDCFFKSSES
jgi:site-specific DNA-cytosine methylase